MSANGTPGEGENNEEAETDRDYPADDYLVDRGASRTGDVIRWTADKTAGTVEAAPTKARDGIEVATRGERTVPGAVKKTAYVTGKTAKKTAKLAAVATAYPFIRAGRAAIAAGKFTKRKGDNAIAHGMLAVAAGEEKLAERHAATAQEKREEAMEAFKRKQDSADELLEAVTDRADEIQTDEAIRGHAERTLEAAVEVSDDIDKLDLEEIDDERYEAYVEATAAAMTMLREDEADLRISEGASRAEAIRETAKQIRAEKEEQMQAEEEKAQTWKDRANEWRNAAKDRHHGMSPEAEAAGLGTTSEDSTPSPDAPESVTEQIAEEGSQAGPETSDSKFGFSEQLRDDEAETEAETEVETETENDNGLFD